MGEDQNEWYIKCKTGRICLGRYSDWFYDIYIYIYIEETDHPSNNFDNNLVHHAKVWWQRATLADIRMSGPCWSLHVIRLRGRLSSMWHLYGGPARCWNWQNSRYAFVIIYLPYIYNIYIYIYICRDEYKWPRLTRLTYCHLCYIKMWVKLATLDSLMQDEDDPCVYIQDTQLTQKDHKKNLDPNSL